MPDQSLLRFRMVVSHAVKELQNRRAEVNNLNVFPVADGDTGDNMLLTLESVMKELKELGKKRSKDETTLTLDQIGRETIVQSVARAALLGARGNSGVILSQFIRGAAQELISRPGELIDPTLISAAMARATDAAYAAVRNPVEGTILTTMREMSSKAASLLAHQPHSRFTPDFPAKEQNAELGIFLHNIVEAGVRSVEQSPNLLPALKEAGVVDSGAHALTIIFAAVVELLTAGEIPTATLVPHYHPPTRVAQPPFQLVEQADFRYCVNLALTGENLENQRLHQLLEPHGNSILVVGDRTAMRVHIHSNSPETIRELFADAHQQIVSFEATDMHEQIHARTQQLQCGDSRPISHQPTPKEQTVCAALAVVHGEGIHRLYADLGIHTLDGGPTFNPSTADLLTAITELHADEVILFPNSKNVWLAAQQAAELANKPVELIQSTAPQAGLAAAVTFNPNESASHNRDQLNENLEIIQTATIAPAARDDANGRFKQGDAVGFINNALIAWGTPTETLEHIVRHLNENGAELITCISGENIPLTHEEERLALQSIPIDAEHHIGNQSTYWWLISAE